MTTAILYDLAILAILLIFMLVGASRGLLLSLCGLVAMLVAFVGAGFVADLLAPKVADFLEPKFASAIEARLETSLSSLDGRENIPLSDVTDALKDMGLYQSAVDAIDNALEKGLTNVVADTAAAVAASIAGSVAYTLLYAISFVIILILWTVLSHALDLVARLPGLHALNKTGGALLGLLKGCAILFFCAWVLRYMGTVIPERTVNETRLLHFFMTTNPVALVLNGLAAAANRGI